MSLFPCLQLIRTMVKRLGLSLEEIGEQMSLKKETIGTRLFYARKKIQACMAALLARERGAKEQPA